MGSVCNIVCQDNALCVHFCVSHLKPANQRTWRCSRVRQTSSFIRFSATSSLLLSNTFSCFFPFNFSPVSTCLAHCWSSSFVFTPPHLHVQPHLHLNVPQQWEGKKHPPWGDVKVHEVGVQNFCQTPPPPTCPTQTPPVFLYTEVF